MHYQHEGFLKEKSACVSTRYIRCLAGFIQHAPLSSQHTSLLESTAQDTICTLKDYENANEEDVVTTNVDTTTGVVNGYPVLIFYALENIAADNMLAINYGRGYWWDKRTVPYLINKKTYRPMHNQPSMYWRKLQMVYARMYSERTLSDKQRQDNSEDKKLAENMETAYQSHVNRNITSSQQSRSRLFKQLSISKQGTERQGRYTMPEEYLPLIQQISQLLGVHPANRRFIIKTTESAVWVQSAWLIELDKMDKYPEKRSKSGSVERGISVFKRKIQGTYDQIRNNI
jgi:hypothetical protein